MLTLYIPGTSPVHRLPAWLKFLVLCVGGTAVMFVTSPVIFGCVLAVILFGYAIARIRLRTLAATSIWVVVIALVVAGFQWIFSSAALAFLVGLRIIVLVLMANLVTLTTPMAAIIDVVEKVLTPLRHFGVRTERVGLAVSLALRFIPVISHEASLVRQAQRARGASSTTAYLTAVLIRVVKMADGVGQALEARGMD